MNPKCVTWFPTPYAATTEVPKTAMSGVMMSRELENEISPIHAGMPILIIFHIEEIASRSRPQTCSFTFVLSP
jgi:hypothetical protein